LVNKSYSTLQLIDNAVAVATITGSAGWEAFLSGKPVMKFGNSFYQYAPGVFNVKSEKQMEVAVSEIFNGFEPDFNKIKSFLKACENASVKAWTLEEHKAALSNNSLEENTNNLCLAIIEMINNKSVN
jgi:capsule polysaccharide export protein KpsC/LpsZ